jgi:hypothetical protein
LGAIMSKDIAGVEKILNKPKRVLVCMELLFEK